MTTFTDEVRATVSPHKFGGDRRAAAAWLVTLDGCEDEQDGDVERFGMWFARIGRTIVATDEQGFVWCERFDHELRAIRRFEALSAEYGSLLEADEQEAELYRDGFRPADSVTIDRFFPGEAVRVEGMPGVAFRVDGLPTTDGPDTEWSGITYQHPERRLVHMVGDDRTFDYPCDILSALDDADYCGTCGQIGCGWH